MAESTVYGARQRGGGGLGEKSKTRRRTAPRISVRGGSHTNQFLERERGESSWVLRDELGKAMWERVGIVRRGEKLKQALGDIAAMRVRAAKISAPGGRAFNLTWQEALDLRNLLTASELIARSALMREFRCSVPARPPCPASVRCC